MKRSRMESIIIKFLLAGASIILTCVLISIGIIHFRQGQKLAGAASGKIADFNNAIAWSDITMYDGLSVKGSDVINFYKRHLGSVPAGSDGDFFIVVKTDNGENTYKDGSYAAGMKDGTSSYYIKPSEKFTGEVEKNANGIVIKITFTQE